MIHSGSATTPPAHADCVLIASGSQLEAQDAARVAGLEPRLVIGKHDCARPLSAVRRRARDLGIHTTAIHSADWDRQALPQLFELAAARLGLPDCRVIVGDGKRQMRLSRPALALNAAALPLEAAASVSLVGAEIAQLARARRRSVVFRPVDDQRDAVLAIWPGAMGANVGGAVTHMSGILAAFRRLGFHVGLLALGPPPPQLAAVADDVEVAAAPPRAARLTGETAKVCSNRLVREAGARLLGRLSPCLVYQRHEAFITFGVDVAEAAQAPLVLEWNNSEVWAHRHWHVASPAKRAFRPLAATMERHVLSRARLIVAVSSHAAEMALEEGAAAEAVLVLPNGVDIEAIDDARREVVGTARDSTAVVGWVGSFETWHGADVLVRALTLLDEDVHAMLIGDGAQRPRCESLARELGVEGRIEWTGSLPHSEAVRRLAACDLLASPHVQMQERPFFGSPTKVFEYMAIGRPIVASRLEQIGEILDHDRTAVLVAPGDAEDLARGIEAVLDRPDRGLELGLAARREAENQHTWDARVRAVLASLGDSRGAEGAGAMPALQLLHSD